MDGLLLSSNSNYENLQRIENSNRVGYIWEQFIGIGLWFIRKGRFHPGEMAPSEWMHSVRAVRDILGAAYSRPAVITTRRVPCHPPSAVSLFLLALSVSYLKCSAWRYGQLRPYVGMGSLGARLHQDCNAVGDAAKTSPCIPSTYMQNAILSLLIIHIIPSHQIYVAIDNPSLVPCISCLTTTSYL